MVHIKTSSIATVLVLSATAGAVVLPSKGGNRNTPAVVGLGAGGNALGVHEGVVAREYKHGKGEGEKGGRAGKGKEEGEGKGKRSWKGRLGRRGPWRNQPEEDLINVNLGGGVNGKHPHGQLIDIDGRHSHDHDEHDHHHHEHDQYDHHREDINIHSNIHSPIHARHSHDHEGKIVEIEDGHHRHHEYDGYRHEEVHEHIHARHSHDHDDVVVIDGGRHGEWRDDRHGDWTNGRHGDVEVHEHEHIHARGHRGGETVVVAEGGRHRGSTVVVDGQGQHRGNDVTVVNQRDTIIAEGSRRHGDKVVVVDNNRQGHRHHNDRPITIVNNHKRFPGPSFLKRHDHDTITSTGEHHNHNNVMVDSDRHHSIIVDSDRHGSTIVDSDRQHDSTIVDSNRHHTDVTQTDRHGVESVVSTHHKRHSQRIIVTGDERAYRDTDAFYRYGHESARFGRPIMFGRGDGFNRVKMVSNRPWGYERVVEGYAPIRAGYGYSGYRDGYYKRHDHKGYSHDGHREHGEHGEWRDNGDVTIVNNEGGRHRNGDVTVVNNHKRRHEEDEDRHRENDVYNLHGECRHGKCDGREDVTVVNTKRQSSGSDMGGAPGYIDVTSPVFNSTTAQRIASLVLSTSNGTDANSTFVLNASNNIRTQVYLVPLPSNTTSTTSSTSADAPIPVNLKLPIFVAASASVESYCATFDPDPSAPAPLTVTPCSNGTTSHESQKFLYNPTTGVIHPDWQPSPVAQQLLQSNPDSVDDDDDSATAQNVDDDDSDLSAQNVSPTGAITADTTGAPTTVMKRAAVQSASSAPPPLVTGGPSTSTNSSTVTPSASNVTLIFTPANPTLTTESTDPTTSALYGPTPDAESDSSPPLASRALGADPAYYPGEEQNASPYAYYPGDGYTAPEAPVDEEPGMATGDDTSAGYTFAAPDAQAQQPMAAPESYTAPYDWRWTAAENFDTTE